MSEVETSSVASILNRFPNELIHHILSYVPFSFMINNFSRVSRRFYEAIRNLSWLNTLDLSIYFKIDDTVFENILRTRFLKNNKIQVLNLSYCGQITDASLRLICEYFPRFVYSLVLPSSYFFLTLFLLMMVCFAVIW
jgi:hypothetical protein